MAFAIAEVTIVVALRLAAIGFGTAFGGARLLPAVHFVSAGSIVVVMVLRKSRNRQGKNSCGHCELK
jgi:hypothetical protein